VADTALANILQKERLVGASLSNDNHSGLSKYNIALKWSAAAAGTVVVAFLLRALATLKQLVFKNK
jgi:hypothetical protein